MSKGAVWSGLAALVPLLQFPRLPWRPPDNAPLAYTPPYLAEKILTSRSALEGERKQVTVLFADLKGSTELIRDLDPEQASLLDPALHADDGRRAPLRGHGQSGNGRWIMALFGAPLAHEDHAAAPAMPPWPCRTPCGAMPRRCAAATARRADPGWAERR